MNFIELIFKLIARFIDLEPGRLSELKDKAAAWQNDPETSKHKIFGKLLEYQKLWYVQILLCFVLLFSIKKISRWMVEDNTTDKDEDEDYDDYDFEDDELEGARSRKIDLRF